MTYESATSAIEATGTDSACPFTISGQFDGHNISWTKNYPTWDWAYKGKVVKTLGPNMYYVAGVWGEVNSRASRGTFAFLVAPQRSTASRLNGEWIGQFRMGTPSTSCRMRLKLVTPDNTTIGGEGRDHVGKFTINGTVDEHIVQWKKSDLLREEEWEYNGALSEDGTEILGTWGKGSEVGTFTMIKLRKIDFEEARRLLPEVYIDESRWRLDNETRFPQIEQDVLQKVLVGFQSRITQAEGHTMQCVCM